MLFTAATTNFLSISFVCIKTDSLSLSLSLSSCLSLCHACPRVVLFFSCIASPSSYSCGLSISQDTRTGIARNLTTLPSVIHTCHTPKEVSYEALKKRNSSDRNKGFLTFLSFIYHRPPPGPPRFDMKF